MNHLIPSIFLRIRRTIQRLNISVFALLLLSSSGVMAQFETNRLKNTKWYSFSPGFTSSDRLSGSLALSLTKRNDMLASSYRLQYQHQLSSPTDSCDKAAYSVEFAALWGEGISGKSGYIVFLAGMGLTRRTYCQGEEEEYARKSRTLVGVPVQIEMGLYLNKKWSVGLNLIAGWNFLEPYAGGQLKLSYHLDYSKIDDEE
ncbi:MAG: hypothetical protein SGI87_10600 [Flavobacteriales bacterium]|nr:hypothetical protein [Flavobacteriales bacterium]